MAPEPMTSKRMPARGNVDLGGALPRNIRNIIIGRKPSAAPAGWRGKLAVLPQKVGFVRRAGGWNRAFLCRGNRREPVPVQSAGIDVRSNVLVVFRGRTLKGVCLVWALFESEQCLRTSPSCGASPQTAGMSATELTSFGPL